MPRWLLCAAFAIAGIVAPSAQTETPQPAHATDQQYNRALGVTCEHCHVAGRWQDASKPAFTTAQNMQRMVAALNGGALEGVGEISCWSCHGGQQRPSRLPRESLDAALAQWPAELASAPESQKLAMAVYSVSLGVGCEHCHSKDWKNGDKEPLKLVARMNGMFTEFPKYMPASARTQCWMCHKGTTRPQLRPAQPPAQPRF